MKITKTVINPNLYKPVTMHITFETREELIYFKDLLGRGGSGPGCSNEKIYDEANDYLKESE